MLNEGDDYLIFVGISSIWIMAGSVCPGMLSFDESESRVTARSPVHDARSNTKQDASRKSFIGM
jgi:hypothetical protein